MRVLAFLNRIHMLSILQAVFIVLFWVCVFGFGIIFGWAYHLTFHAPPYVDYTATAQDVGNYLASLRREDQLEFLDSLEGLTVSWKGQIIDVWEIGNTEVPILALSGDQIGYIVLESFDREFVKDLEKTDIICYHGTVTDAEKNDWMVRIHVEVDSYMWIPMLQMPCSELHADLMDLPFIVDWDTRLTDYLAEHGWDFWMEVEDDWLDWMPDMSYPVH